MEWRLQALKRAGISSAGGEVGESTLITGATSGIGAAFADRLAQQGFHLILHGRRKETLTARADDIERTHLEMGPGGTLWVQHVQTVSALTQEEIGELGVPLNLGSPDWDVFDPEGRFLGVASMPKGFEPSVFRSMHVYGTWRDPLQVPHVVRLRIVGDVPGPHTP